MYLSAVIATVWPLDRPFRVEPLRGGINNRTFRVRSRSGEYILRIYPSSARREKIAFEMQLLDLLSCCRLPFQVPVPLPSRSGEATPRVPLGNESPWAMIVPVLPGSVREPVSLDQACAVGTALGSLVKAMGSLSVTTTRVGNYGNLEQIDPLLPDPLAAARLPMLESGQQKRLARLLEEVLTERQSWYSTLPQQVIHGDYVPFNILMLGDQVSAVLDFELACHDIRTMDFAIGFWPWVRWGDLTNWEMADAFSQGYTRYQDFTVAEAEALPFLLRLRRAATLVWWAGRYLHGTADESAVQWVASSALQMEDWLDVHRGHLVERATGWASPKSP